MEKLGYYILSDLSKCPTMRIICSENFVIKWLEGMELFCCEWSAQIAMCVNSLDFIKTIKYIIWKELFTQEVLRVLWEDYRTEAQLRQVMAQKQMQRRQSAASRHLRGRPSLVGPNLLGSNEGKKSSSGNSSEGPSLAGWEAESEGTARTGLHQSNRFERHKNEVQPLLEVLLFFHNNFDICPG